MATHSSVLAWRIPGTGEPGGLPSMGSHRVGHDWSDLAAAAAAVTIVTWLEWLMLLPVAVSYMDLHIGYWKQLTVDWNNWYLHNPGMEKLFENCYDWLETQAYRNSKDKEKRKKVSSADAGDQERGEREVADILRGMIVSELVEGWGPQDRDTYSKSMGMVLWSELRPSLIYILKS